MIISNYTEFENALLMAACMTAEHLGDDMFPVHSVLEKFALDGPAHWLDRAMDGLVETGMFKNTLTAGSAVDQDIWITASGIRRAEQLLRNGLIPPSGKSNLLGSGNESIEVSADLGIGGHAEVEFVPASDRIVPLNHNAPEYQRVEEGLSDLLKLVRENNEVGETTSHRERIILSLVAAQNLWKATELKLIQIQAGVVLAIEDAGKALTDIGKLVGIGLLIDAIKTLVKVCSGIEF